MELFTQKYWIMWIILMFKISSKNSFCDTILGSDLKISDLVAHFSRNSGTANTVLFTYYSIFKCSMNI